MAFLNPFDEDPGLLFLGLTASTTRPQETYKGTGAARIINSDKAAARKTALKSAIFDASTKQRSNLFGYTSTQSGRITDDATVLYTNAKLVNYTILEEKTENNLVKIAVNATFSKNYKKLLCNKEKTKSITNIYYPTVKYRNISGEEKFLLDNNLARSFARFKEIRRKPKVSKKPNTPSTLPRWPKERLDPMRYSKVATNKR